MLEVRTPVYNVIRWLVWNFAVVCYPPLPSPPLPIPSTESHFYQLYERTPRPPRSYSPSRPLLQPGERAKAPAWRDVDSRIRRALPVLALPPSLNTPIVTETGARMVTVNLTYLGAKERLSVAESASSDALED